VGLFRERQARSLPVGGALNGAAADNERLPYFLMPPGTTPIPLPPLSSERLLSFGLFSYLSSLTNRF